MVSDMTKIIDVKDSKLPLSELLLLVEQEAEVILTSNNEPRARVLRVTKKRPRIAGLHQGAMTMSDDFDLPLADEFWMGEE